jgi:hypothetical protein
MTSNMFHASQKVNKKGCNKGMVVQFLKNTLLKMIYATFGQLLRRGDTFTTPKGKKNYTNFKCAWKGRGLSRTQRTIRLKVKGKV